MKKKEQISLFKGENYESLKKISKPAEIYCQGLIYHTNEDSGGTVLYESGGLYGESVIKMYSYPEMKVLKEHSLPSKYFGEGIAICNNEIYQLTWKEKKVLKYSLNLDYLGELPMPPQLNEGWGLTSDTERPGYMYATDGSDKIYHVSCSDGKNLEVEKEIIVHRNENHVYNLNDLTFANGFFYVNIYYSKKIIKVDRNGKILKAYDLSKIVDYENKNFSEGEVLNGITYKKKEKTFIISGKVWDNIYELNLN